MNEVSVTVHGYVARTPELKQAHNGNSWAKIRVGSTPRIYSGRASAWVDGPTIWYNATFWGDQARNLVSSVKQGTPVILHGHLGVNEYTITKEERDAEGIVTTCTVPAFELMVEHATVGIDLTRGTAIYCKTTHTTEKPPQTSRDRAEEQALGSLSIPGVDGDGVVTGDGYASEAEDDGEDYEAA